MLHVAVLNGSPAPVGFVLCRCIEDPVGGVSGTRGGQIPWAERDGVMGVVSAVGMEQGILAQSEAFPYCGLVPIKFATPVVV